MEAAGGKEAQVLICVGAGHVSGPVFSTLFLGDGTVPHERGECLRAAWSRATGHVGGDVAQSRCAGRRVENF